MAESGRRHEADRPGPRRGDGLGIGELDLAVIGVLAGAIVAMPSGT